MNLSALSFRDFRIYLGGNLFASNALWMQRVTIGWLAWDLTSSATFVGFVAFINFAPSMIIGPFFGVLIDRVRIKQAAKVTQLLSFMLALGFYLFFTFGILNEVVLSVLSGFSGLVVSAHTPVRMSLAPRLVDRTSVASVITIGAINFNLARLTGPALGGWLIAVWGVSLALLVQMLCYLPFLFAIGLLRPRERLSSGVKDEAFFSALNSGIRHVLKSPFICRALLITALYSFLIRGTLEILPVIADGLFNKGAAGLGLLTSSAGFGALLAGMTKALMPGQTSGELPKYVLASALVGIALVSLLGLSNSWGFTLICISYLGFSSTLSGISIQTAIQIDLDDSLRGRVMSLWTMVGIGATAMGAIALGGLADYIGFTLAFGAGSALGIVVLATFALRLR
ncbi:MAG: MFS transporter [Planktomarina sp.]|jgi:MFS family permease|nr:MFS transporter [Planktomarina sp.]MDT2056862.1 MFS transporter [Planktomarina sp.]MDT2072152.1 MFS transporter [Planktomarina sp.]MDT2077000.1 MFS transporter [Planktomarina sp.]